MSYSTRYEKLNSAQKEAVDTIEGPVMVIAGPGTGKTELLSMRAGAILSRTDTLPESILCLTFTESGAHAMRERMAAIFGASAYRVAVHTFHSFGSEIINQYGEYFYEGSSFSPADELASYEILRNAFAKLPHGSPLASRMNGEYTYLRDVQTAISELKRGGLSPDELLQTIDSNGFLLDEVEADLAAIFTNRISKTTAGLLTPIAVKAANAQIGNLPPAVAPLGGVLAISLAQAIDSASESDSTKPITAWKNRWLEKNSQGGFVFKDRKRHEKLAQTAAIYRDYQTNLKAAGRFDFDDMIMRVLHAIEQNPDLRYNLQERYLYIMVDEFQDTNMAQMRLLSQLTALDSGDAPNLMVVGDDDQAIYSFQGAELSNLSGFIGRFETATKIVLTDNYRSDKAVLATSQRVVRQISDRLETSLNLNKTLTPHYSSDVDPVVKLIAFSDRAQERALVAKKIASLIKSGEAPSDIAVIARYHREITELLPYFASQSIGVSYERRDNVLEGDTITSLLQLARIVDYMAKNQLDEANALLPELLSHPMWQLTNETIWNISLAAYTNRSLWLQEIANHTETAHIHTLLTALTVKSRTETAETMLDLLTGSPEQTDETTSPLYGHFFSQAILDETPSAYLEYLRALQAIRQAFRNYQPDQAPKLHDFIAFVDTHIQLGRPIMSLQAPDDNTQAIHLLTAHKAKGLEYKHVFVIGANDSIWGEKVRSRSRLIGYPENLVIAPAGDTIDERLRLFFVAMTRAKNSLTLSYSKQDDNGKSLLPASFLSEVELETTEVEGLNNSIEQQVDNIRETWTSRVLALPHETMSQLLKQQLASYKLSTTHLGNFLDVSRGGPQNFLMSNLLRFPQSMSPDAGFGSAVHGALQHAHSHVAAHGTQKPIEDVIGDFTERLQLLRLSDQDVAKLTDRGSRALHLYLEKNYDTFSDTERPELSFVHQQSRIGEAHLTGILDIADIDKEAKTIHITDYKTGKPSESWTGKSDYEKIKLHKYRHQLLFYELLVKQSRDYSQYSLIGANLQFVEPNSDGHIAEPLTLSFSTEELEEFSQLIQVVWRLITSLELPDTSIYTPDYVGMQQFEADLLNGKY